MGHILTSAELFNIQGVPAGQTLHLTIRGRRLGEIEPGNLKVTIVGTNSYGGLSSITIGTVRNADGIVRKDRGRLHLEFVVPDAGFAPGGKQRLDENGKPTTTEELEITVTNADGGDSDSTTYP